MALKDIPVVALGPGSQPGEADGAQLGYIDMPRAISTYREPLVPEPKDIRSMTGAMETMEWLQKALEGYDANGQPKVADISALDEANRDMVNQILGEGEVSIQYSGTLRAKIQESVLAGVWRTFFTDEQDHHFRDLIEVSEIPALAKLTGNGGARNIPKLRDIEPPPDVMNAMPILAELADHLTNDKPRQKAHVINLTLLPLSPEDVDFLDKVLSTGPVRILSRGYGDCAVTSTAVPHVWWVRYYNSTGKLILNTLEVVEMPIVACAAPEDIRASAGRLKDILEPYANEEG